MTMRAPAWIADWWKSIATAPKDGTEILVAAAGNSWFVVFWDDKPGDTHCWQTPDGVRYHNDLPTHWMPLPPQPHVPGKPRVDGEEQKR